MRTFRVLGPLAVVDGDRPALVSSSHQRRLLSALLVHAGRPVSIDALVDALWADDPPRTAPRTLQVYVARLRGLVGSEAIRRVADGYLLVAAPEAVDAARFETLAARALTVAAPTDRLRLLGEALDLWHGDPYPDLPNVPSAQAEAVRLVELRDRCREDRAEAMLAVGRSTEAVADMLAMTVSQPLRERPWRLLMLALHRSGRQAEALAVYRRYDATLADEGLTPPPSVDALRTAILATPEPPPAVSATPAGPHTAALPIRPPTSLVGRDDDLAAVLGSLRRHRLVTLTGPAGVGKSRLATEAAVREAPAHLDGARTVSLAAITRDGDVCHAIAAAVGISLAGQGATDRLVDALTGWNVLLLLDGAEHVLKAISGFAAQVLHRCHGVTLLVTSQERLAIPGEQVLPVAPLATDGPDSPAVHLFRERAGAAGSVLRSDPGEVRDVVALCGRLDGLPLALEMAAARTPAFTPRDLLNRMDRRFSLLRGARASDGGRHATLGAAIDWSYRLLETGEQELFAAVAVFPAGFDADAAAAVVGGDADDVRRRLTVLVDRSMVTADLSGETARFRLLETLHAYSLDILNTTGRLALLRTRHAAWALHRGEQADAGLRGRDEASRTADLDDAVPDLRSAFTHALATRDIATVQRVAAGLLVYAYHRLVLEPTDWADTALATLGSDTPASVLVLAAIGHVNRGDIAGAQALAGTAARERAVPDAVRQMACVLLADAALYRGDLDGVGTHCRDLFGSHDPLMRALAHQTTGVADAYRGRARSAGEHAAVAGELSRSTGSPSISAWANYVRGEALAVEHPQSALAYLDAAVAAARRAGNRLVEGVALVAATACRARHDQADTAVLDIAAAIGHWHRSGDWTHQWPTLRTAAILLSRLGRHEAAVTAAAAVSASAPAAYGKEAEDLAALDAAAARDLGTAGLRAAHARGDALEPGAAVAYVLTAVTA